MATASNGLHETSSPTEVGNIYVPHKKNQHKFNHFELELCTVGQLFGQNSPRLPSSDLLMLDRVVDIQSTAGDYGQGYAIAEYDIDASLWFFEHHFSNDPIMPGCLIVESLWQLTGFYLAWLGYKGKGRLIDTGRTRFYEEVNKEKQTLVITIHARKLLDRSNPICIANGTVSVNNKILCKTESLKVGLV